MMKHTFICLAVLFTVVARDSFAQQHYFIDGFHGGKYGHYPSGYTGYIVEQLQANPFWKINLEIEPETWDVARVQEPEAYAALKKIFADQSGIRQSWLRTKLSLHGFRRKHDQTVQLWHAESETAFSRSRIHYLLQ
jgi:hypothetical protein